jgi:hypothetical protein
MAAGMLLLGLVLDAAFTPRATVFGPTLLAVWIAATARNRAESVSGWLVALGLMGAIIVSLTDLANMEIWIQKDDGAITRSAALGITLLVSGLVKLHYKMQSRLK